jgi:hypothetical protein
MMIELGQRWPPGYVRNQVQTMFNRCSGVFISHLKEYFKKLLNSTWIFDQYYLTFAGAFEKRTSKFDLVRRIKKAEN